MELDQNKSEGWELKKQMDVTTSSSFGEPYFKEDGKSDVVEGM